MALWAGLRLYGHRLEFRFSETVHMVKFNDMVSDDPLTDSILDPWIQDYEYAFKFSTAEGIDCAGDYLFSDYKKLVDPLYNCIFLYDGTNASIRVIEVGIQGGG